METRQGSQSRAPSETTGSGESVWTESEIESEPESSTGSWTGVVATAPSSSSSRNSSPEDGGGPADWAGGGNTQRFKDPSPSIRNNLLDHRASYPPMQPGADVGASLDVLRMLHREGIPIPAQGAELCSGPLFGPVPHLQNLVEATRKVVEARFRKGDAVFQLCVDIDDTLFPSYKAGVAGTDRRPVPTGTGYPCVCQVGLSSSPLPVLVVSANPRVGGHEHLEKASAALCRRQDEVFGVGGDLASWRALLGAVSLVGEWGDRWKEKEQNKRFLYHCMGLRKRQVIAAYRRMLNIQGLDNVKLVFCGDTGQGDVYCAEENDDLAMAFLHVVDSGSGGSGRKSGHWNGVTYFCDYREVLTEIRSGGYNNHGLHKAACPTNPTLYAYAAACTEREAQLS
jgi:hypothetical protein